MQRGPRWPKNHHLPTRHAEEVLLDRFRVQLDIHYENVQRMEWEERLRTGRATEEAFDARRRLTNRIFGRVLEAETHARYESFELPRNLKGLLRKPADERSIEKATSLRQLLLNAAENTEEIIISTDAEATQLCAALDTEPPWRFVEEC